MPSSQATRPISWLMPKPRLQMAPRRELEQRAAGDDLAHVERQRRLRRDRLAQRAGVVGRVLRDVRLPLVRDRRTRSRSARPAPSRRAAGRLPRRASWRTWAMTMPPLLRAAMAMASISPWTASPSMVRLPSSSAVVPRMTATSIGNAWNSSHSRPRSVTTSTRSSVVAAFCLPPVWRGSTYVPRPTCVTSPGRPAAISRISWREHALGERVRLELVGLHERAEARLVADVAADRAPRQAGQAELGEAAIGEVADADDAHRRQVARVARLR